MSPRIVLETFLLGIFLCLVFVLVRDDDDDESGRYWVNGRVFGSEGMCV